jgi:hypothetical protein
MDRFEICVYYLDWERVGVPLDTSNVRQFWKGRLYKLVTMIDLMHDQALSTTILEQVFGWMNRGSPHESYGLLMDKRSLSVGDIITIKPWEKTGPIRFWVCAPVGWETISLEGVGIASLDLEKIDWKKNYRESLLK